jgi:hypothetical protein
MMMTMHADDPDVVKVFESPSDADAPRMQCGVPLGGVLGTALELQQEQEHDQAQALQGEGCERDDASSAGVPDRGDEAIEGGQALERTTDGSGDGSGVATLEHESSGIMPTLNDEVADIDSSDEIIWIDESEDTADQVDSDGVAETRESQGVVMWNDESEDTADQVDGGGVAESPGVIIWNDESEDTADSTEPTTSTHHLGADANVSTSETAANFPAQETLVAVIRKVNSPTTLDDDEICSPRPASVDAGTPPITAEGSSRPGQAMSIAKRLFHLASTDTALADIGDALARFDYTGFLR